MLKVIVWSILAFVLGYAAVAAFVLHAPPMVYSQRLEASPLAASHTSPMPWKQP